MFNLTSYKLLAICILTLFLSLATPPPPPFHFLNSFIYIYIYILEHELCHHLPCTTLFLSILNSIELSRNIFCEIVSTIDYSDLNLFQAILASAFAKKDYTKATATASRVLQVCWLLRFLFIWLYTALLMVL